MIYVARSKPQGYFFNTVIEVFVFVAPIVAILFGCVYFKGCRVLKRPSKKQHNTSSSAQTKNEVTVVSCENLHSSTSEGYHTTPQYFKDPTEFFAAPVQARRFYLSGPSIQFDYADIRTATNNFDDALKLGEGGFGKVYKGELVIHDMKTQVAIKRWNGDPSGGQGYREFQCEIQRLSEVRHKNIVPLIGHCGDYGEMILVYEYMSHGTLRSHLYKTDKPPLSWETRLRICIGAARGLHYLHTGPQESIIHRDVKSNNILVDANWEGRIADFGLCKPGPPTDEANISVTVSDVKGTPGYLDPEYSRLQRLTKESDVYSFGVVLLEVICARAPIDLEFPGYDQLLSLRARRYYEGRKLDQKIDPRLKGQIAPKCFKTFVETAMKCLADRSVHRPSMQEVVYQLVSALKQQDEAEKDPWARAIGRYI